MAIYYLYVAVVCLPSLFSGLNMITFQILPFSPNYHFCCFPLYNLCFSKIILPKSPCTVPTLASPVPKQSRTITEFHFFSIWILLLSQRDVAFAFLVTTAQLLFMNCITVTQRLQLRPRPNGAVHTHSKALFLF